MTLERFRQFSPATRLALILIALGLIILLLRVFSGSSFVVLSRFWPLLLVGFGLDLLGKRPHPELSYGMLSVLVLLALMLFGPAFGLTGKVSAEALNVPLANTRSADIELDLGAAPTTVSALNSSEDLLRADITNRDRVTLQTRGRAEKTVRLGERGRLFGFGSNGGAGERWQIGLSPAVPLELSVDGGSGLTALDLERLNLTDLELEGGSGTTRVTLPASSDPYQASWDGGSGQTRIVITDGAAFDFEGDGGSGGLDMIFGRNVTANLEMESGSGPINLIFPPDAAVKVEVEDTGSGALELSERFSRISGDDDNEGTWETSGFSQARSPIVIRIEGGGSGKIDIF